MVLLELTRPRLTSYRLCIAKAVTVSIAVCFLFLLGRNAEAKTSRDDKVRGAVAMSIYADAMGLPFEFSQDLSAAPSAMTQLEVKESQAASIAFENAWGVWNSRQKKQTVFFSDDSFFKLDILTAYLNSLAGLNQNHSDLRFFEFVSKELQRETKTKSPFAEARSTHLASWKKMMMQMFCNEKPAQCKKLKKTNVSSSEGRSFYSPKTSICFGIFMYSLTGLWDAQAGSGFETDLDTKIGNTISNYFRNLIAYSVRHGDASKNPANTERLFYKSLGKKSNKLPIELSKLRTKAFAWAKINKHKPVEKIWKSLEQERAKNLPSWITPLKFDPAEFAFVFWAALGVQKNSAEGMTKPLLAIANSGGDTDTIASLYGSFLGAHHGERYFKKHLKLPLRKLNMQIEANNLSIDSLVTALENYSSSRKRYRDMRAAAMKEHKKTKSSGVEVEGLPANALLVDVRSNAEIGVSMIDGAISEQEFKKMTIKDQKAQPIVFYCTIGYRSGLAAKRYAKQGIDAKNLIGGVSAWAFAKKDFVHKKLTTKNVHTYNKEWNYLPTTHTSKVMPQP